MQSTAAFLAAFVARLLYAWERYVEHITRV